MLALVAALCSAGPPAALGFTVDITPGSRALFLQVGAGTVTGGNFNSGGTPGSNTTVNSASVTVPSAQIGSGAGQTMTTDSTLTASAWDGRAFCTSPASTGQVYVGGFFRRPGNGSGGSDAMLSVSTPAALINADGATLAFSNVAWTSSGNGDSTPTLPSGAFTGGAQTLLTVTRNTWFESCLAFRYLNTQLVPAGTFTGRATFTLSTP
ncbi:hypothetical protein H6CHR_00664 [Variovorax sp. PBL-H6]|nr:hypothetical protein H6CHR_00664 [Variovorax sp. PBL-H6]